MDEDTARSILATAMQEYRGRSYEALAASVGHIDVREVRTSDGTCYQLELQVFWEDKAGGALRVVGGIDDGGLRAFFPLTLDFLRKPDESVADD